MDAYEIRAAALKQAVKILNKKTAHSADMTVDRAMELASKFENYILTGKTR